MESTAHAASRVTALVAYGSTLNHATPHPVPPAESEAHLRADPGVSVSPDHTEVQRVTSLVTSGSTLNHATPRASAGQHD